MESIKVRNTLLPDGIINGQKEYERYLKELEGKQSYAEFPEVNINPFLCLLVEDISQKWVRKGKGGLNSTSVSRYINSDTGEEMSLRSRSGGILFEEERYIDDEEFVKMYKSTLKHVFSLSSTALKMFGYFIGELDHKDADGMVYMSMDDAIRFCKYRDNSRASVYRGLSELILKCFICKTDRPWTFFVNPKYAFNGNRVSSLLTLVRKGEPDNKEITSDNNAIKENW